MKRQKLLLTLCAFFAAAALSFADLDEKSERMFRDSSGCPDCVRTEYDKGWCGSCSWYNWCGCTSEDEFEVELGEDQGECVGSSTSGGNVSGGADGSYNGTGVEATGEYGSETTTGGHCEY